MSKIRRGDTVQVVKGNDRGKKGKVLKILLREEGAIVEGINLIKKHKRRTSQEQQGGIVSIEAPVNLSNLKLFCKNCNRSVRVGFSLLKDGTKSRICKRCNETIS